MSSRCEKNGVLSNQALKGILTAFDFFIVFFMTVLQKPSTNECIDPSTVEELKESILRQLRLNLARNTESASSQEIWTVCLAVLEDNGSIHENSENSC